MEAISLDPARADNQEREGRSDMRLPPELIRRCEDGGYARMPDWVARRGLPTIWFLTVPQDHSLLHTQKDDPASI